MARTSRHARRNSPLHLPSAFDLFRPSKEIVLNNIWIFGPLYAVPLIFYIHSWLWSPLPHQSIKWWQHSDKFSSGFSGSPLPAYGTFLVVGFSLLWLIIIVAIGTIVQVMTQEAQLRASESKRLDFQDLWGVAKEMSWSMFKLYILSALAIILTLFIFTRRYFLSAYVMLDKKTGVRESMKISSELSARNPGSVWGVVGVIFLIALLNILPWVGGLLSFGFSCLYSVAPAMRYQQLKRLAVR